MNQNIINDCKIIDKFSKNELLIKESLIILCSLLSEMLNLIENDKYNYNKDEIKNVYEKISLIDATYIRPLIKLKNEKDSNKYLNDLSKIIERYSNYIRSNKIDSLIHLYINITKKTLEKFSELKIKLIESLN